MQSRRDDGPPVGMLGRDDDLGAELISQLGAEPGEGCYVAASSEGGYHDSSHVWLRVARSKTVTNSSA